jgi:hypothetical protein
MVGVFSFVLVPPFALLLIWKLELYRQSPLKFFFHQTSPPFGYEYSASTLALIFNFLNTLFTGAVWTVEKARTPSAIVSNGTNSIK